MRDKGPLVVFRLTTAEVSQILSYIKARDQGHDAGWYFGPKAQFERRHKILLEMFSEDTWNDEAV